MTSANDPVVLFGGRVKDFPVFTPSPEAMRYLIIETAEYGIQFGFSADYEQVQNLTILRLQAFGLGGDLLIRRDENRCFVGSSRVDLQACKLEYSIVSPK